MEEPKNKAVGLARAEPLGPVLHRWSQWLPLLIVATSVLLAGLLILREVGAVSRLRERIQEENRLRMQSSQEHVSDYLEVVYSMLLFSSQNEDVIAMRREAAGFIQKLYDHGWENHELTEVYVVERDFRGDRRPFMTFEREPDSSSPQIHVPAREQQEYRVQMEQIQRFSTQPGLRALLSPEILLCVPEARGSMSRGFVYSVPIWAGNRLPGIVAHAQATQAVIRLAADDRLLTLVVTDNGVGLPDSAAQAPGMGLRIMRYRADLIGADLQIRPAPEKGTTVTCACPRPAAAADPGGVLQASNDELPE